MNPSPEIIVRHTYFDDAGLSNEPYTAVGGIMLHVDIQYRSLQKYLLDMADALVGKDRPQDFYFHGKELWHGEGFFPRDKWSLPKRMEILGHLADIPKNFNMPIFYCCAERAPYLKDIDPGLPRRKRAELRAKILKRCHTICFLHCLSSADKWVDQFHPDEQVFVVVEHHDNHKNLMLGAAQFFADPRAHSFIANDPNIKWGTLKHMVEEPLFMRKSGISPLQVADTCAFILSRALAGANHIDVFLDKLRPMLSRGFIREFFHDSYREQSS